jgi:anti-sigma regulatory factor (Ser/Thr protein kinase)
MPDSYYDLQFEQPRNNNLGAPLKEVIDFLSFIEKNPKAKNIIINLSNMRFVQPTFILALASLSDKLRKRDCALSVNQPVIGLCSSYLRRINFPEGIKPDEVSWESVLARYRDKTFLPIINFPCDKSEINTNAREKLFSQLNLLIKKRLKLATDYESAVSYLISEISDNIIEHSGTDRGWLMVQFYPNTFYLDICIIDTGKTILGSYQDSGSSEIKDDTTAIERALAGISTKSIERGTGLRTSRAISTDGLEGDFLLYSGNALFYKNSITRLPANWPGTFVAMRINSRVTNFSLYNFV